MSSQEQALASLLTQVALSFDGAVLGVALAYAALRSLIKYTSSSKSVRTIKSAPYVTVSDLRSLVESGENEERVVVVRGHVDAKSSLRKNVLVSPQSGDKAVIIQRTQTCIYNEWKGLFGWTSDLRAIFGKSWRERESKLLRTVPFVLVEDDSRSHSDHVVVNMDGSKHPLPLITVYHQLRPIDASPYTFLQALFGHEYPVGLLDEEKILPLGKEISAVGICHFRNGIIELKSSKDLPFFLLDLTKDQMVAELVFKTRILMWSGIVLGSLSIGILGYAIMRNWNRLKIWGQHRRSQQSNQSTTGTDLRESDTEEEVGDVPNGQLCVICLMRRRRAAFIPCGHLICCQLCAISVERQVSPTCPLCRQDIRSSMRIFEC